MTNVTFRLADDGWMRVEPLCGGGGMLRVRYAERGDFPPSVMERYGLLEQPAADSDCEVVNSGDAVAFRSEAGMRIWMVNKTDGSVRLRRGAEEGAVLSMSRTSRKEGGGAVFRVSPEERFYGLGYRKRDGIELRGRRYRNHVTYGSCYGPVPFLMSSGGWGVYFNTTFDSTFDVAATEPDRIRVWSGQGELDLYLMAGGYPDLLDSYTALTGRPMLMPLWGHGLQFICNEKENQFDVLNDAASFRREGIPADMMGLEPGWMAQHYDRTVSKDWDKEKFYMPWWSDDRKMFRDVTFIGALKRRGFRLSLWLCCDYDVFEEEERLAKLAEAEKTSEEEAGSSGDREEERFEIEAPDFDPRAHAPVWMDRVTEKSEPWFGHLKKFVDQGVAAFKQDPAFIVNDHPDRLYANGMTDAEAHNLISTVLAKQVHQGYKDYTGLRPMHVLGTSYTGTQKWAPLWTCDCGGREEALAGLLQYSLCGHMNVTCDMDVNTAEGIHFGFLQPWSLVNSWAYIHHPWWLEEELYRTFLFYARLHYRLIPYLYSYAHAGHRTGMPILRAMPLQYPDVPEVADAVRQYMLGEWLLVGAFTDQVYLPPGRWMDYWTGEWMEGGRTVRTSLPEGRGGPLFVKAGAILPMWPEETAHTGLGAAAGRLTLCIYPGEGSRFRMIEDDGETYAFEGGEAAVTEIICTMLDGHVRLELRDRAGEYKGKPAARSYALEVRGEGMERITVNGAEVWREERDGVAADGAVRLEAAEARQAGQG